MLRHGFLPSRIRQQTPKLRCIFFCRPWLMFLVLVAFCSIQFSVSTAVSWENNIFWYAASSGSIPALLRIRSANQRFRILHTVVEEAPVRWLTHWGFRAQSPSSKPGRGPGSFPPSLGSWPIASRLLIDKAVKPTHLTHFSLSVHLSNNPFY